MSTLVTGGAMEASRASAVMEREAARDVFNISSGSRCRAVRLLPEAVFQCDADPVDMILVVSHFLDLVGMSSLTI
jgi:hypothetical protein